MTKKDTTGENYKWDSKKLSNEFLSTAHLEEIYLDEISDKAKSNISYQEVFDEHLAKFYVYNHLHGRTYLDSKESLIAELESMQANPASPFEAYEAERFKKHYCIYVKEVLRNLK